MHLWWVNQITVIFVRIFSVEMNLDRFLVRFDQCSFRLFWINYWEKKTLYWLKSKRKRRHNLTDVVVFQVCALSKLAKCKQMVKYFCEFIYLKSLPYIFFKKNREKMRRIKNNLVHLLHVEWKLQKKEIEKKKKLAFITWINPKMFK